MIRINLAKKGSAAATATDLNSSSEFSSEESSLVRKTALVRLALIVMGPVGMLLYEQQVLPDLQGQLQRSQQELSDLNDKNNRAAEAVEQTKKFKKEQEVLQAQINSIESLKKDRLREVKLLDFIQKDLPNKMWLTRMEMNEGKLNIQGLAITDNDLTHFMDNLSRSAYLKEVSLIRSTDYAAPDVGPVKRFEISCLMENSP